MEGQALVVVNDANLAPSWRDAHVVRTMLEMIAWLEHATTKFVTVILGGEYAWDREIIGFLRETYPAAQLVLAGPRRTSIATA
jgi:hypothetical protein